MVMVTSGHWSFGKTPSRQPFSTVCSVLLNNKTVNIAMHVESIKKGRYSGAAGG